MSNGVEENAQKIDDILASADPNYVPSTKEILEMIDTADMDDEMRESLKNMLSGGTPKLFGGYGAGMNIAIAFAAIIFSIILFFGYKLYKSIRDKEKKKEEKRKLKEMKKKK